MKEGDKLVSAAVLDPEEIESAVPESEGLVENNPSDPDESASSE